MKEMYVYFLSVFTRIYYYFYCDKIAYSCEKKSVFNLSAPWPLTTGQVQGEVWVIIAKYSSHRLWLLFNYQKSIWVIIWMVYNHINCLIAKVILVANYLLCEKEVISLYYMLIILRTAHVIEWRILARFWRIIWLYTPSPPLQNVWICPCWYELCVRNVRLLITNYWSQFTWY